MKELLKLVAEKQAFLRVEAEMVARAEEEKEREQTASQVMQEDLGELLRVLGLGDHARPVSPHEVMANEVIPAARLLMEARGGPVPAAEP